MLAFLARTERLEEPWRQSPPCTVRTTRALDLPPCLLSFLPSSHPPSSPSIHRHLFLNMSSVAGTALGIGDPMVNKIDSLILSPMVEKLSAVPEAGVSRVLWECMDEHVVSYRWWRVGAELGRTS